MVKTSDFESENSGSSPGEAANLSPVRVLRTILCANPTAEQILAALAANGFGIVPLGAASRSDAMTMLRSLASGKVEAGKRIAEVRKENGVSQEKLAELVDCHPITISKLERNEMDLTIEWLLRIADALHVDAGTFLSAPEAVDDPKAYVLDVLKRHNLKPGALATKAGVQPSTLSRALNDPDHKFKFSVGTLQKIRDWDRSQ